MLVWFVVIGIVGTYGVFNVKSFQTSLSNLTNETLPNAANVSRLSTATSSLTGTVRRFALVDTQIQRRLVYNEITSQFETVDALASGLSDQTNTAAFAGILSAINQLVDQLNQQIENRIVAEDVSSEIAGQLSSLLDDRIQNFENVSDQQKVQILAWESRVSGSIALAVQSINISRLRAMRVLRRNVTRQLAGLEGLRSGLPTNIIQDMRVKEQRLETLLLGEDGYFESLVEGLKLTARVRGLENQILTLNEEVTKLSDDVFQTAGAEVTKSVRVVNAGFEEQLNYILMTGFLTILSIGAVAYMVHSLFVARLNRLNKEVQEYSELEDNLITISGKDEITGIAKSISSFITEIENQQRELRKAKAKAEDATKVKSEFLATMSHEIRTPMNGVVSMTQMLSKTELDNQQKELVEIVEQSAGSLLTIINDILDFSRIEAGKLEIEEVEFNIRELVASVSALCGADAYGKGLELFFDIAPDIESYILGDSTRVRQILLNLTSNAVKFTENGYVKIDVSLGKETGKGMLHFRIEDTGIGISEEAIQRLFVAFAQADGSTVRRFGGSGLGLSICKRLVDLMGGDIGVESTVGTGSVFYFSIPFLPAENQLEILPKGSLPKNIYVAVMHEQTEHLISSALSSVCENLILLDATAPQSWNGMIRQTGEGEYQDIVLFDHDIEHNPEITPYLKVMANEFDLNVLALAPRSAMTSLDHTDWVNGVIPKPLNAYRLYDQLLSYRQNNKIADTNEAEDHKPSGETEAVNTNDNRSILIAEDNPINQKVIATTLDHLGYTYTIVADGVEAYEEVERNQYGVVLTDFHMPRMDGIMLTKLLKAHGDQAINSLPVVMLTADAQADAQQVCINAGADGFLTKPINLQALTAELDKWLSKAGTAA
ncbi:ATP-binding protein [Kordiimonas sp. SCSIO 12610]|uniref:hybrid sensor histidine kinase/response regulator n=1 Tax=Kordiimonas sp. SCSIO 12610 TaxID=2829597 RepID=UPI00210F05B7|nr:ATP-binding protein [Kordiimonas sp. SCSIO 12610]UTW55918.1 response regulator [Kordiimonas sp. SCSIO 12610]